MDIIVRVLIVYKSDNIMLHFRQYFCNFTNEGNHNELYRSANQKDFQCSTGILSNCFGDKGLRDFSFFFVFLIILDPLKRHLITPLIEEQAKYISSANIYIQRCGCGFRYPAHFYVSCDLKTVYTHARYS